MSRLTKQGILLSGLAFVIVVVFPLLNILPPDSSLHLPNFYLNLFGKYLSLAILALGLDLLWGYAGILSLGQAVFFGIGGYAIGMHLMLGIDPSQTKYGEAIPDFMVWNQIKTLPLFWEPFHSFILTVLGVILVPVLFGALFGYLTFRSRIRGVYIAILTQALAFSAWLLFNRNEMKLGGTNGLTDFKTLLGFSLLDPTTQRGLYIVTALCLFLSLALCHWIVTSKFGKVLRAIRDSENRLRFVGYSITRFKVFIFSVSAGLAGLAGALYVPQVGIITPSQIGVIPSIEVVIWVAVGGRGALIGGPLGALLVNGLRSNLTGTVPHLWPFFLGGLFVSVVLFFPNGVVGIPAQIKRLIEKHSSRSMMAPLAMDAHETPIADNWVVEESHNIAGTKIAGTLIENKVSARENGPGPARDTILYLEDVTVSFEGFLALNRLNFYMDKGELCFVIGPNGAGKTTLLDVVCGRVKPIAGRVLFEDTDLLLLREHEIANHGVGRKFQTPTVFPHHTVRDNVVLAVRADKGVVPTLSSKHVKAAQERINAVLETVGLISWADEHAGSLSHGQKQWLEIGMLIAQDPRLLLLDEPVAGMTGREREQTGLLLEAISRQHSVLVIEHDMEFVRQFSNRVTVLHEGSVLCEGAIDKVQNDPQVIEVYLGRSQEVHA